MSETGSVRRAIGNRKVLAALAGSGCFSIVEYATWLALLLYAFARGGVAEAGIVAFALLIPAALVAPLTSVLVNRVAADMALTIGFLAQAATCTATAAAMLTNQPGPVVYGAAGLFVIALTVTRPTVAAVLPTIAAGPAELAAANSLAGVVETFSAFAGPALAAAILVGRSPGAVFVVSTFLLTTAAGLALTMDPDPAEPTDTQDQGDESALAEIAGGFRLLRREPSPRLLVMIMVGAWMVYGALDVALVAVAVDQLERSEATAGVLSSAFGVGGVIGSILSFGLIGRRRLSLPTALALLAIGLPIVAVAASGSVVVIMILLAVAGLGDAVADVATRTLLQGLAAEDTLARLFGVVEGLGTAALAVGSVVFSQLALRAGLGTALIATGAVMPVLLLINLPRLLAIDRARPVVDPLLVNLVRSVPIFAPLPAFRVEQLLTNFRPAEIGRGRVVFNRGDVGDRLYVVAAGTAVVELEHYDIIHERGGFFGEIALLNDQPRMATVRAGDDGLVVYSLDRGVFLDAISSFPRSHSRTVQEADRRLGGR